MRTQAEIKNLLEKVLAEADAPEAEAYFDSNHQLATRFGGNAITQNTSNENEHIYLKVAYGNKHGGAQSNRTDEQAVRRLLKKAQEIAKQSPEDSEYVETLPPQNYPDTPSRFFHAVESRGPIEMADEIRQIIAMSKKHNCQASGLSITDYGFEAMANKKGLFVSDQYSKIEISVTANGSNGSGSGEISGEDPARLDPFAMAQETIGTADAAQSPKEIEPGDYTVIFEPRATMNLLTFLLYNLSARTADEGASPFSGKLGQKLFSEKVNMSLEIDDPELPARKFGQSGLPLHKCKWIENGILANLYYDRYWAKVKNCRPHAALTPLFMRGENHSIADLIANCKRGLLVKNLWYIRYVDEKEMLLTGMTRDGLFLVEDAKIRHPVKNMRFNESPMVFLKNIVGLSRDVRVGSDVKVPGVMSENFTFSSGTESV